jgi:hypothetical protein
MLAVLFLFYIFFNLQKYRAINNDNKEQFTDAISSPFLKRFDSKIAPN